MKLGVIGPSRCNHVDIGEYVKGIEVDEIISNFYYAMGYAAECDIPYTNVCRLLPPPLDYSMFNHNGTKEQIEYIVNNSDIILEFSFGGSHFNDFSFHKPRKLVKVYRNEKPSEDFYTSVEVKRNTHYVVERHDHEFSENRTSLCIYEFQELQESFHDHLKLEITGSLDNQEIYGLTSLTLVGTSLNWLKHELESRFPEIYTDKRNNYELTYLKGKINETLCEFKGYTGYHFEADCLSLKDQFDLLESAKGLVDDNHWLSFGEVPLFNKFKKDNH